MRSNTCPHDETGLIYTAKMLCQGISVGREGGETAGSGGEGPAAQGTARAGPGFTEAT